MRAVLDQIARQQVIPVIRSDSTDDAVATAQALARAGMSVIELTRSVPAVHHALEQLGDDGLTLGVGTITDATQVEQAAAAGAQFVVSFTHPESFLDSALAVGVTAIPGAFTPSEIATCANAGARVVKLFPARLATPDYLHDIRAVLPSIKVVVTGGVTEQDEGISAWLRAGALAVGLGSDLGTVATVGTDEVQRRARAALDSATQRQALGNGPRHRAR